MPRISKLRFSIASVLIVTAAFAVWLSRTVNEARIQSAAVALVKSNEGIVQFRTTASVPSWICNAIGDDYFRDEKSVDFATNSGRKQVNNEPKATDADLKVLQSLTGMETLELGHNPVTDEGLAHLKSLKNLKTLYLHRTRVKGPGLSKLTALPNLEAISLANTSFGDDGVVHLAQFKKIDWVSLEKTRVTDASMSDLANAVSLKLLNLRNTSITDVGLKQLTRLKKLEQLSVQGTAVTAIGVASFKTALPNCKVLTTYGLGLEPQLMPLFPVDARPSASEINAMLKDKSIDGEVNWDILKPLDPITNFRLSNTTLSSQVVLQLMQQMPELEVLNLRGGLVDDSFAKNLVQFQKIKYLSLQSTQITDECLHNLSLLPNLEELNLSETTVTDRGLVHLGKLPKVKTIILDSTKITDNGGEELKRVLPNCRINW